MGRAKLTLILASAFMSHFPLGAGSEEGTKLVVRVHNRAEANARVLSRAQGKAKQVFKMAGIELYWVDCTISAKRETPEELCLDDLDAESIRVTILPLSTVNAPRLSYVALGLTLPTGILVFADRILKWAQAYEFSQSEVMAIVLAHELGHGLLGPGHAPDGLMIANLLPRDIRSFSRGELCFTPEQAEFMRARLRSRDVSLHAGNVPRARSLIEILDKHQITGPLVHLIVKKP